MRHLARLRDKLGRRGLVLLMFGLVWVGQGFAVRQQPYSIGDHPVLAFEYVPVAVRVALWLVSGLFAVYVALTGSPERDRHGYTVLVVLPIERSLSYAFGWVEYMLPTEGGYAGGLRGALTWLGVTVAIMVIAGWPEPQRQGR